MTNGFDCVLCRCLRRGLLTFDDNGVSSASSPVPIVLLVPQQLVCVLADAAFIPPTPPSPPVLVFVLIVLVVPRQLVCVLVDATFVPPPPVFVWYQ